MASSRVSNVLPSLLVPRLILLLLELLSNLSLWEFFILKLFFCSSKLSTIIWLFLFSSKFIVFKDVLISAWFSFLLFIPSFSKYLSKSCPGIFKLILSSAFPFFSFSIFELFILLFSSILRLLFIKSSFFFFIFGSI